MDQSWLRLLPFNNLGSLEKNFKKQDLQSYTENVFDNYFYLVLILLTMIKKIKRNSKMKEILNFKYSKINS